METAREVTGGVGKKRKETMDRDSGGEQHVRRERNSGERPRGEGEAGERKIARRGGKKEWRRGGGKLQVDGLNFKASTNQQRSAG